LQWLRGFYFVAEKGTLHQASIAMGREKATISRQIKCLEKELGVASSTALPANDDHARGEDTPGKGERAFEYLEQIKDDLKNREVNYRERFPSRDTRVIYNVLTPFVGHFRSYTRGYLSNRRG